MVSFTSDRESSRNDLVDRLRLFEDLVGAGLEIVQGQLGLNGLEPISKEAADVLVEARVVATRDQGIVLFHERIGRNKPHLRRILARVDRSAGRLPKVRRTTAQRAYQEAVRAGLVVRDRKTGRIRGLTKTGRAAVKKATRASALKETKRKQGRQRSALRKLKGIGA